MIEPGRMLLHYRLVEKIGEGGMGVVWKALDTSLDREVAIKILPEPLGGDAERLARFEREAKLLASLNHPNIAGVYGLHEAPSTGSGQGGVRFIAMELVNGEDLAARLGRGPLTIESSLTVARNVAEALEAAHENGVIHRDLKPANIVRAEDGTIKVLDFGLAKAFDPSSSSGSADPAFSPTMTSAGSHAGMVLGTAAYMSPEQARGKPVDKRSDIWSFGVVLHQVLTGKRLFEGETFSDTIAMILQTEPDWSALPATTPPRVRELLQRCLEKDSRARLRDIGDARIEIKKTLASKEWTREIAAAAARAPGLTPDGRTVVFYGDRENLDPSEPESTRIFVRPLESAAATPLAETEDATVSAISPDGRWLAYVAPIKQGAAQRKIFKVPLDGSTPPMTIADWNEDWSVYMLWLPSDRILVSSQNPIVLVSISADGSGSQTMVRTEFPETVPAFVLGDVLPDGVHVLGTSFSWEGQGYHDQTYVVNIETGSFQKLLEDGSNPRWSPTGHLVFSRQDTLLAAPFDPDGLELTAGAVALADGLRTGTADASAVFGLSPAGTLVHQSGGRVGSRRRVISIDDGTVTPWSEDRLAFQASLTVSPDGRNLATTVMKDDDLLFSVWVSEVERPRLRLWKAMDGLDCAQPVWHPDNRHLVYNCVGTTDKRGVYIAPLDDSEAPRLLWRDDREGNFSTVRAVHPNGRHVLIDVTTPEGVSTVRISTEESGAPHPGEPAFPDRMRTSAPAFSPDGAWVSYYSDDSGRAELFVAPFDEKKGTVGRAMLVASTAPAPTGWYETDTPGVFFLAYRVGPWRAEKVRVRTAPRLSISDPEPFIDFSKIRPQLVGLFGRRDGRFLGIQQDEEETGTRRMELILNFERELEKIGSRSN